MDDMLACDLDLNTGWVTFRCGWRVRIWAMVDEDGEYTDEPDEAIAVILMMPEIGLWAYELDEAEEKVIH